MKKFLIQICIAAGFVVAAAVSGSAQISQSYRAHIPFDFAIENTAMKAGDYRVGPVAGVTNERGLQIQSLKSGKTRLLGLVRLGSNRWGKSTGRLVFSRNSGQYALANVETPTFVVNVPRLRTNVKVVTQLTKEPETVSVALH